MRLRKVLAEKGLDVVFSIPATKTIREAVAQLVEHDIGALLVSKEGTSPSRYLGIVSERDILRHLAVPNHDLSCPVSEIMQENMIVAKADDNVDDAMRIMTQSRIRHLPVLDDDKVIGLISVGDVIKAMHEEKEIQITYLSDFASGIRQSTVF